MDMFIENFHFLRPLWLLLLIPLVYVLYQLRHQQKSLVAWQKVCAPELLAYLKVGEQVKSSAWSIWVMALSGVLAITALSGPVWEELPQPVYKQPSALVIVFDVSQSMNAADIKPSRLIRAKQKVDDLLKLHKEGQTALVAFAGTAYVVTPLTEDNETILSQLDGLTPDIMPKQGGMIDAGLQKAIQLFAQASILHGQVLLITDSEDFSKAQVDELTSAGHRLNVVGVGTASGAPIPKGSGGFLTDNQGNIVVPQLAENRLKDLALTGQGLYRALSLDNTDIQPTLSALESLQWQGNQPDAIEEMMKTSDQWHEEGPWLLLAMIPLVLLGFRRSLLAIALCVWLQPAPAQAGLWQDLWQTKHQQAQSLMAEKQYEQAAKTFNDPAWKASAAYRNQDYEGAVKALNQIEKPLADDLYNQGNALAQLGRLDEAIKAYDEALKLDANHADAKANKDLLEKQKQEQESQDNQKSDQNESDKNESEQNKSEQDKQDKSEQGNQSQESQDQQSQQQNSEQSEQQQSDSNAQSSDQQRSDEQQQEKASEKQGQEQQDEQQAKQQEAQENKDEQGKAEEKQVQQQERSANDLEKQEAQQAFEQSLRRIPDDPSGLLRRKFLYQYQQQQQAGQRQQQGANQW